MAVSISGEWVKVNRLARDSLVHQIAAEMIARLDMIGTFLFCLSGAEPCAEVASDLLCGDYIDEARSLLPFSHSH